MSSGEPGAGNLHAGFCLGRRDQEGHAYSVRRRRESAYDRKAPHGLPSSRLVSTILLDLWFEKKIRPTCQGEAYLTRFADGTPVQTSN